MAGAYGKQIAAFSMPFIAIGVAAIWLVTGDERTTIMIAALVIVPLVCALMIPQGRRHRQEMKRFLANTEYSQRDLTSGPPNRE
jgi:hypothetical protein